MSLIEDALKRQEEIRRNGYSPRHDDELTGQNTEESSSPTPQVKVRGLKSTPVQHVEDEPPQARSAQSPVQPPPKIAPPRGTVRNREEVPVNPFLEQERAARKKRNPNLLMMPILALVVFFALLFLKREVVSTSSSKSESITNRDVATEHEDDPIFDQLDQVDTPVPLVSVVTNAVIAQITITNTTEQIVSAITTAVVDTVISDTTTNTVANTPSVETPSPQRESVIEPEPISWPKFSLTGIAVGRERLAILSSGEMLTAGESAKCGVKIVKVTNSTVTFSYKGERKTLRKGEMSDKPVDE